MVDFAETSHKYNASQTQELHKQIQKSMKLSRRLESLTNEMKQSEEFKVKKAVHETQTKASGTGGTGGSNIF